MEDPPLLQQMHRNLFTFSNTTTGSELYDQVEFHTDSIYNRPPPSPFITLLVGSTLSVIGFGLWVHRVQEIKKDLDLVEVSFNVRLRCWLTAYTENDSALFTCVRMAAQSFLLLTGLQWNYQVAFLVMLGFFALESCCDTWRVLLVLKETKHHGSFDELTVTSKFLRADLRKHPLTTTLTPGNVYEDLTRDSFVVGMVFVTQTLMIIFVVVDVLATETHYCLDGTPNCPVAGTLGSYAFYVLGIFMACVFQLGPKTNFGRQSEQNPAFWLKLLLSVQQNRPSTPSYSWYDPIEDIRKTLRVQTFPLMMRYILSFLINGVGFHILVHALPIQVAASSSLTTVVFRAVGMIYLVDLDDTTGYEMTMIDNTDTDNDDATVVSLSSVYSFFTGGGQDDTNEVEMAHAAEKIICKAQAKLDALKYKKKKKKRRKQRSSVDRHGLIDTTESSSGEF